MSKSVRFILVHGAWHGAWCWYKVLPRLRALGHRAEAIDLPGHGADRTPASRVGFEDYVARVGAALDARVDPAPAILVGHSMGGLVISAAAERWPERVSRLVYVCAVLPVSGDSLAGVKAGAAVTSLVRPSADGSALELQMGGIRDAFFHDCSDEDVALAEACLCPQPAAAVAASVALTEARFGRVPRSYIECLADRAIEIEAQRAMQRATPCSRVHRLDAGHSPFFSQPDLLARALHETAAD
jgi:pimeloyl-ACP methyl ester carboxylesterase